MIIYKYGKCTRKGIESAAISHFKTIKRRPGFKNLSPYQSKIEP